MHRQGTYRDREMGDVVGDEKPRRRKRWRSAPPRRAAYPGWLLGIDVFNLFLNPVRVLQKSFPRRKDLPFVKKDEEDRVHEESDPGNEACIFTKSMNES